MQHTNYKQIYKNKLPSKILITYVIIQMNMIVLQTTIN